MLRARVIMKSYSFAAVVLSVAEGQEQLDLVFEKIPAFIREIYCVRPDNSFLEFKDPRVTLVLDKKEGPERAINRALQHVKEDFLTLIFPSDRCELYAEDIPLHASELVFNQMYSIDDLSCKKPLLDKFWLRNICMPQINLIGAYIPVEKLKEVGGFPESLKVSNDHKLILNLEKIGVTFRKARLQKTFFRKGGVSTKLYEIGIAESATISGYPYRIFGIIVGVLLVIKNGGSIVKYVRAIRERL